MRPYSLRLCDGDGNVIRRWYIAGVADGSADYNIEATFDAGALLDQIRRELRIEMQGKR